MARFTLPRDIYHGEGALEELKNLKGKKAIVVVGGGAMKLERSWNGSCSFRRCRTRPVC